MADNLENLGREVEKSEHAELHKPGSENAASVFTPESKESLEAIYTAVRASTSKLSLAPSDEEIASATNSLRSRLREAGLTVNDDEVFVTSRTEKDGTPFVRIEVGGVVTPENIGVTKVKEISEDDKVFATCRTAYAKKMRWGTIAGIDIAPGVVGEPLETNQVNAFFHLHKDKKTEEVVLRELTAFPGKNTPPLVAADFAKYAFIHATAPDRIVGSQGTTPEAVMDCCADYMKHYGAQHHEEVLKSASEQGFLPQSAAEDLSIRVAKPNPDSFDGFESLEFSQAALDTLSQPSRPKRGSLSMTKKPSATL